MQRTKKEKTKLYTMGRGVEDEMGLVVGVGFEERRG